MSKNLKHFFLLTIAISWLLWLPTVLHAQWRTMPSILLLMGMFASFTPTIIGLLYLKKENGAQFSNQLRKSLSLKFPRKWLLFMLIFPLQSAVTLSLAQFFDKGFTVLNPIHPAYFPLVFLQILFNGGALGEEFGWRGFALERLQTHYGPIKATLILGVIWSFWHLPLFFMLNTVQSHLPIWEFMLQNTLLAYFYTLVFNRTEGNMVLMILLHAVMNTSAAIFPYWQSELGRFIGFGILFVMVVVVNSKKLWKK